MECSYDYQFFDTIDSTNNEAKRRITDGALSTPTLLVAHEQTAGRGRQGKSFYSPHNTGLYMTVVIPLNCPIEGQVSMTTRTAVAVARALEEEYKIEPAIKWVNDIYVNDRKCVGILSEAVNDYERGLMRFVIIGIGINIITSDFPEDISNTAGCIVKDSSKADDSTELRPSALADNITLKLLKDLQHDDGAAYLDYYRKHSNVIGRKITFTQNGIERNGFAVDVDEAGGLIVDAVTVSEADDLGNAEKSAVERIVLSSGEISVRTV